MKAMGDKSEMARGSEQISCKENGRLRSSGDVEEAGKFKADGGKKHSIKVYARIRPRPRAAGRPGALADYEVSDPQTFVLRVSRPSLSDHSRSTTSVPLDDASVDSGWPQDSATATSAGYSFRFAHVFGPEATQDEVFDRVAAAPVASVVEGFNATLFVYGQTGSGKTFTMTGGGIKYADRGIVPRSLSHIFAEISRRGDDFAHQVFISYIEIYNNEAYDLLGTSQGDQSRVVVEANDEGRLGDGQGANDVGGLDDLPRVTVHVGEGGTVSTRNMSRHRAESEEAALDLLFIGDTNRAVAETPANAASSRSHAVFTVFVTSTRPGTDVVRRSKLNLVDLAGSERVHRTGADGLLLKEACSINLALHFLERVIVALQKRNDESQVSSSSLDANQKHRQNSHRTVSQPTRGSSVKGGCSNRQQGHHVSLVQNSESSGSSTDDGNGEHHVPYRDSILTMLLKDSLGGNCMTCMVATIDPLHKHLPESMSSCRFAMRVAQLSTLCRVNEETDLATIVARLKAENNRLRTELALAQDEVERIATISGVQPKDEHAGSGNNTLADGMERTTILDANAATSTRCARLESIADTPLPEYELRRCIDRLNSWLSDVNATPYDLVVGTIRHARAYVGLLRERLTEAKGSTITTLTSAAERTTSALSGPYRPRRQRQRREPAIRMLDAAIQVVHASLVGSGDGGVRREVCEKERVRSHGETDRQRLFCFYKEHSGDQEAWAANKAALEDMASRATTFAESISERRGRIQRMKLRVRQLRTERAIALLSQRGGEARLDAPNRHLDPALHLTPLQGSFVANAPYQQNIDNSGDGGIAEGNDQRQEREITENIVQDKAAYRDEVHKLRALRAEMEHVRSIMERHTRDMVKGFEEWIKCGRPPLGSVGNGEEGGLGISDEIALVTNTKSICAAVQPLPRVSDDVGAFVTARQGVMRELSNNRSPSRSNVGHTN